jgi:large subunit ribosomal protein L31
MKANIHPKWFDNAKFTCTSCGNAFFTGSTQPEVEVEVCANCHPFYTGQMKFIDTAGRVDSFIEKRTKARKKLLSKGQKREMKKIKKIERELDKPESLAELRSLNKTKSKKAKK